MRNVQDDLRDSLIKLKIVLETIEAQMRTDSKNNGFIDLSEIKKYQDELNSDVYDWNQFGLSCKGKTIDDVIDIEALQFFNIDRAYQEYSKMDLNAQFKEWLKENGYNNTNGTIDIDSGLTDYQEKNGKLFKTNKLAIECVDNNYLKGVN